MDERKNVRLLQARWVITGTVRLATAGHLGGGDEGPADLNVVRDRAEAEGRPLMPGASLAGALRSHLADRLGGYGGPEDGRVTALFGAIPKDDQGTQSPLVVFDALGTEPTARVEIRDGVAITACTGTAQDHKKYDFEVLPAGTAFAVRVDLLVEEAADEPALLSALLAALDGLAQGEIALGLRRSRGLGELEATEWRAWRFDLASSEGWLAWLAADPLAPLPDRAMVCPDPRAACQVAAGVAPAQLEDARRRVLVTARLEIRGGVLVRSPATNATAPDAAHLSSGGRSVLPGTGLGGALRNRAARILGVVRLDDRDQWVTRLFGPELGFGQKTKPHASRLRVAESVVEGGGRYRQSRIRVDRATHGVARGALFDEEPHGGGHVEARLELRDPRPGETGLLLLLVKDLLAGDLPVGGAAAVGRGVLSGRATVSASDTTVTLSPPEPPAPEQLAWLNDQITELREVLL